MIWNDELLGKLREFVAESNRIEGIGVVQEHEVKAHFDFMNVQHPTINDLEEFVFKICGKRIRALDGMNVLVGSHVPPLGGSQIVEDLKNLLVSIHAGHLGPYEAHIAYETLHPFMDGNGRSGRVLWAWQMIHLGLDPFALPFLHRFYYQTLDKSTLRR